MKKILLGQQAVAAVPSVEFSAILKSNMNTATQQVGSSVMDMESLGQETEQYASAQSAAQGLADDFAASEFMTQFKKGRTDEQQQLDIEGLTYGALEAISGQDKLRHAAATLSGKDVVQAYHSGAEVDLQAYDPLSLKEFAGAAAFQAMGVVTQSKFGQLFFPTFVMPMGTPGYEFKVALPRVYRTMTRGKDGAITEFGKATMTECLLDDSILDNNSTKVVPVVRTETEDRFVDVALVPSWNEKVLGESIATGALLAGVESDLISMSSTTAILNGGVFDETDALDTSIQIDRIFFTLSALGGGTAVPMTLQGNVSSLPGTLLAQTQDDSDRDYHTATKVKLNVSLVAANLVATSGSETDFIAAVAAVAPTAKSFDVEIQVQGTANTETANGVISGQFARITAAYDVDGGKLNDTILAAIAAEVSGTFLGGTFDVNRSSYNLRFAPSDS